MIAKQFGPKLYNRGMHLIHELNNNKGSESERQYSEGPLSALKNVRLKRSILYIIK